MSEPILQEWHSKDGRIQILRRNDWMSDSFRLFFNNRPVCQGSFDYVTNYYWKEFA